MITGFIATCPACGKDTRIPTTKIKDSTPLSNFPWFERGKCENCSTPLRIELDLRVTKTTIVPPGEMPR
jgi:RNase P subunit RPR2